MAQKRQGTLWDNWSSDAGLNSLTEDSTANIDKKIALLTKQFNEWNSFQFKDNAAQAAIAAAKSEIDRLNTKRTGALQDEKASGMSAGYDPIMAQINDKINEMKNLPQTDLEKQVLQSIQDRIAGKGMTLTPDDVKQWYGIVEQMQAPAAQLAQEQTKQSYGDIGRYYGGGASQQQRKLNEELAQQRYGQALSIAQQQQGVQQAGIQGATGQGINMAQYQKTLQQQPITSWLNMMPQMQTAQLGAKYGAPVTSYNFNSNVIPTQKYDEPTWEQHAWDLINQGAKAAGSQIPTPKSK